VSIRLIVKLEIVFINQKLSHMCDTPKTSVCNGTLVQSSLPIHLTSMGHGPRLLCGQFAAFVGLRWSHWRWRWHWRN